MKKIQILKFSLATLATLSLLATIPLFSTSCSKPSANTNTDSELINTCIASVNKQNGAVVFLSQAYPWKWSNGVYMGSENLIETIFLFNKYICILTVSSV